MTNNADIYFPSDETERYFIKSIWRLQEYNILEMKETILPKGTVEIIFNLSDIITYINPALDIKKTLPYCFINGINFKPFDLIKSGQQSFLGIQLNAIGLKGLFNVTVKEFNNNVVESSEVCKSLNTLFHQLSLMKTFNEQVETIRNWLHHKISNSKHNNEIYHFHNLFYTQKLNEIKVKEFCHGIPISDRQLRRLSTEWLGMNLETFLLYNKYLFSLHLLHKSDLSLTQIGLEAGYYDQSHFIREFKSYTDLTPKQYQKSIKGLPGHIIR